MTDQKQENLDRTLEVEEIARNPKPAQHLQAYEGEKEITPAMTDTSPQAMLQIVARAASDPNIDVDKMERLLGVQERMMAKQAEINFTRSLSTLQENLPRIKKTGQIKMKGVVQSTYAKYEDIDDVIRPLLIQNGFSLRFNSRESSGKVVITGTLAHRDGHSITDEIPLAIDASGSKNNVQGVGSTIAYGKRYLVGMLLNLVFEGEDDDGQSAGYKPLSDDQATEIKDMLRDTGADVKKFLEYMDADNVDAIDASDYGKAITALRRKKQQATDAAGGQQ